MSRKTISSGIRKSSNIRVYCEQGEVITDTVIHKFNNLELFALGCLVYEELCENDTKEYVEYMPNDEVHKIFECYIIVDESESSVASMEIKYNNRGFNKLEVIGIGNHISSLLKSYLDKMEE